MSPAFLLKTLECVKATHSASLSSPLLSILSLVQQASQYGSLPLIPRLVRAMLWLQQIMLAVDFVRECACINGSHPHGRRCCTTRSRRSRLSSRPLPSKKATSAMHGVSRACRRAPTLHDDSAAFAAGASAVWPYKATQTRHVL